jgi:hypothetical protein
VPPLTHGIARPPLLLAQPRQLGANASGEGHGIVGDDRIDYPFRLGCGTSHEDKSNVEAWIYDSQGIRSDPVEVASSCTT